MTRHTLGTLFRSIFRPFVDAVRDEFTPRPVKVAAAPRERDDQNANFGPPDGTKAHESLSYRTGDPLSPVPHGWASLGDVSFPPDLTTAEPVALADDKPAPKRRTKKVKAMPAAGRTTKKVAKKRTAKRKPGPK